MNFLASQHFGLVISLEYWTELSFLHVQLVASNDKTILISCYALWRLLDWRIQVHELSFLKLSDDIFLLMKIIVLEVEDWKDTIRWKDPSKALCEIKVQIVPLPIYNYNRHLFCM